jgi:hypothetical protein
MIGKIGKAKRYAEELDRFKFYEFKVMIEGDHGMHAVSYAEGQWSCDCGFFARRGLCSHTMALEKVLGMMLAVAQEAEPATV